MTEPWKVSVSGAAFLAVTTCLVGPALVYYGNPDELEMFFVHAAVWLLSAAALLTAAVAAGCQLLPARHRGRAQVLVTAVAACAWLQGSVLTWDYGVLDGSPIRWERLGWTRVAVDALVWSGVPAAALLARRAIRPRLAAVNAFFTVLGLATICALAVPHLGDAQAFKRYRMDRDQQLVFSRRQNAIILVLDAFQSGAFERVLQRQPALAAAFDGFTFFPDAAGGFPTTYPSVPLILTGQAYDNTRPIQDFIEAAYRSDHSLPVMLRRAGWRVGLYPLIPQTVALDPSMAVNVKPRLAASWPELSALVRPSVFRMLPHFGKRLLAPALLRWEPFRHSAATLSFAAELESAAVGEAPEPVFKLIHLSGAHAPFELNERLEPEALGDDLSAYQRQAAGAVLLAGRFLQKLRDLGAYDGALIFILGDHGHQLGGLAEQGTPLLLAKWPGAKGALRWSDAPVALGDVPLTVAGALGLPTWDDPVARSMLHPAEAGRPRRFLLYAWEHSFWAKDTRYLPPMAEYLITGPAAQEQSWTRTGWRFAGGRAVPPVPYPWGAELSFGRPAAGAVDAGSFLAGTGWWAPEETHAWSSGASSLHLPIQPPDGDLELEAAVAPFLGPSQKEQVVTVRANGVEVAVWHLAAPGTVRARIPEATARAAPVLRLTFSASEAHSPAESGSGADGRRLAVAFSRARVQLVPGAAAAR